MLSHIKKRLGYVRRGVIGMIKNHFDAPQLPADVPEAQIGTSIQGKPIECYTIGNGPTRILFVAGIHGNEVGSVKVGRHIIEWLYTKQDQFENLTFLIIPCLNPDGYAAAVNDPDYWNGGTVGRFNA